MKKDDFLKSITASLLLETMAEGVMLIDTAGRIRVWNKAMHEITGYEATETLNKTTEWLRDPDCLGANKILSLMGQPANKEHCVTGCECKMIAKTGERIPVVVNARILRDIHGETIGILQTVTDFRQVFNLQQEIAAITSRLQSEENFHGITGKSSLMQKVFRLITLAADSEASIIISGESGTGKELVADAVHKLSNRNKNALIKVNCGALPETLLESELFGHEKGAFTGAIKKRTGRFEAADGGTIFLDEIGDVSPAMQVKLLRVLQTGELQRVGGESPIKVDVRVIAATNKDLTREVKEGRFREDLYYRLRVFPINVPSLRERHEDIPILAQYFVNRFSARTGRLINGISKEALNKLTSYAWPGNVRELENAIEYAFVVCQHKTIDANDLPDELLAISESFSTKLLKEQGSKENSSVFNSLEAKRIVRDPDKLSSLLEKYLWNKAEVGRQLGMSRTAIWKWIIKHQLKKP